MTQYQNLVEMSVDPFIRVVIQEDRREGNKIYVSGRCSSTIESAGTHRFTVELSPEEYEELNKHLAAKDYLK